MLKKCEKQKKSSWVNEFKIYDFPVRKKAPMYLYTILWILAIYMAHTL